MPAISYSMRPLGQKEDINFLDEPSPVSAREGSPMTDSAAETAPVPNHQSGRNAANSSDKEVAVEGLEPVADAVSVESVRHGHHNHHATDSLSDMYFTALIAGCTAVAVAAILGFGVCVYR